MLMIIIITMILSIINGGTVYYPSGSNFTQNEFQENLNQNGYYAFIIEDTDGSFIYYFYNRAVEEGIGFLFDTENIISTIRITILSIASLIICRL